MDTQLRWRGNSDASATDSDQSNQSRYTADTVYSDRPQLQQYGTCMGRIETGYEEPVSHNTENYRDSFETYATTEPSEYEPSDDDDAEYELLEGLDDEYQSDAMPASPRDFADLFPSSRRMDIRHDDSTIDGNMNLRVDTQAGSQHSKQRRTLTLFHLKMQDLKSRDFSLRRYCRDSGREVCHSVRKYQTPISERRPSFTRSLSNALATLKKYPDNGAVDILRRDDSGYGSLISEDLDRKPASRRSQHSSRLPTNTMKLEFSNYAHVNIKRLGTSASKAYEFEYWGFNYSWVRHVKRIGKWEEVSYHLLRNDKTAPVAHILPVPLTTAQKEEEDEKGGWIPPCSMWIKDEDIIAALPDVAEVVVSTGIIALVDDSIKRRWHSSRHLHLLRPLNLEYIGPKRLIDGAFNRRTQ